MSEQLQKGDKVTLDLKPERLIKAAYKLGAKLEDKHGGCARCTVAALQDSLPFVDVSEDVFRAATCLDGGATTTKRATCGAFTGAGMVIGHVCGSTRGKEFTGDPRLAHDLIHKVHDRFIAKHGSVICGEIREGSTTDCPKVVALACEWTARALLEEFGPDAE